MKQESLTPQELNPTQQTDFKHAQALAHKANVAFDERHLAAQALATNLYSPEGNKKEEAEDFATADKDFQLYNAAAETLMPPRAVFDALEAKTATYDESLASKEVWGAMSHEQQSKATELRNAMAASQLKEYGVSEDTLRVVMTETDGKNQFTLIHTGNGVDIGDRSKDHDKRRSYGAVMSNKNDKLFQIEVDGVQYDSRKGMTDDVYEAKVADARERGVTLPDSKQLSQETSDDWTWTMLTGGPLTADGRVRIRFVHVGVVYRRASHPDDVYRLLRVCPAVVIE